MPFTSLISIFLPVFPGVIGEIEPSSICQSCPEKPDILIPCVFPVMRSFHEIVIIGLISQLRGQLCHAPVVPAIFPCLVGPRRNKSDRVVSCRHLKQGFLSNIGIDFFQLYWEKVLHERICHYHQHMFVPA